MRKFTITTVLLWVFACLAGCGGGNETATTPENPIAAPKDGPSKMKDGHTPTPPKPPPIVK